jgi:hypothetical protein
MVEIEIAAWLQLVTEVLMSWRGADESAGTAGTGARPGQFLRRMGRTGAQRQEPRLIYNGT